MTQPTPTTIVRERGPAFWLAVVATASLVVLYLGSLFASLGLTDLADAWTDLLAIVRCRSRCRRSFSGCSGCQRSRSRRVFAGRKEPGADEVEIKGRRSRASCSRTRGPGCCGCRSGSSSGSPGSTRACTRSSIPRGATGRLWVRSGSASWRSRRRVAPDHLRVVSRLRPVAARRGGRVLVQVARHARRDRRRTRAPARGADRLRGVLRGADEHVVHARGVGVDEPGPFRARNRPHPRLARGRLLRHRPLPATSARDPWRPGTAAGGTPATG